MIKLNTNWAGRKVDILNNNTIYYICVLLKCLIYDHILYMLTMLIIPLNFQKKYHNVIFDTIKYILYHSLQKSKNYTCSHYFEQYLCHMLSVTFGRIVNIQIYRKAGGHLKTP